jgi:hypothetical protein
MLSRTLILLLSVVTVWVPSMKVQAAPAKRTDAGAHFDAAAERYARQDYAGAASEFAIAYALDPQVDTLFAWAQAERLAEHYEQALKLYERLLEGELSANQREAVQTLRFQVRGELEVAQAEPTTEPEAPEPAPTDAPAVQDTATPDHLGVALTGVGAGLTVLAGGLLIGAAVADGNVRGAQTYPDFEAAFDPRTGRGRGAIGLYASGGVLAAVGLTTLVVGAVRLTRSNRSRRSQRVAIAPSLGRDHLGLVLTIGRWP